jgi:hypothetical protein
MGSFYLPCDKGETFEAEFTLFAGCDPFDLTNYSASMAIKDANGSTLATLTSPSGGLVISDAAGGVITATITAATTTTFAVGVGSYLLTVTAGSTSYAVLDGGFEVKQP